MNLDDRSNPQRRRPLCRPSCILPALLFACSSAVIVFICLSKISFVAPTAAAVRRGLLHSIKDAVTEEDTPPYIHPEEHALIANIGRYPNYVSRKTNADGWVKVIFHKSSLTVKAALTGLEPSVTAGVHIHEGMTCCANRNVHPMNHPNAPMDSVGDHYYNTQTRLQDPWDAKHDATYTSLKNGTTDPNLLSSGAFHLYQGYTYEQNVGRVVVVHDSDGVRIGCGVLRDPAQLNDWENYRFINGIEACSEVSEGKNWYRC